jgi:hypothetical protein
VSQNWRLRGHLCSGKHIHRGITENINQYQGATLQAERKQPGSGRTKSHIGLLPKVAIEFVTKHKEEQGTL